MARTRVLVVEDSVTIRKHLADVLRADPDFEVVGEAEDGRQAIELCDSLRPDVISMDMMLRGLSGLAATEHIMAWRPTPILIVSASMNRGEIFKTYQALSAGAVDVLDKPSDGDSGESWGNRYRQALRLVSRIKVITHPRARLPEPRPDRRESGHARPEATARGYRCVAIGASTGGPGAVVHLLRGLPADFPLPLLVVIHIGAPFGVALADWLDTMSPIRVRTVADGQPMPAVGQPQVLMAPPDRHLIFRDGRLWTTSDPERHFCRPSVDVLFESLASGMGNAVVACLLTGMGRDGASGLLRLRQAGGMTIAQDEDSSVIFGMPREAIQVNAARKVLGLHEIAPTLMDLASGAGDPEPGKTK